MLKNPQTKIQNFLQSVYTNYSIASVVSARRVGRKVELISGDTRALSAIATMAGYRGLPYVLTSRDIHIYF